MLAFTPYYDPSPPPWKVVVNSMSSFFQLIYFQKGCVSISVRSLMPTEPILCGTPGLCVVHLLLGISI